MSAEGLFLFVCFLALGTISFCSLSAWKFQEGSDFGYDSAFRLGELHPGSPSNRAGVQHCAGLEGQVRGPPG